MSLLSSTRVPRGAWGCRITPLSCHPPASKLISAGSGWPENACSTWAPHCVWVWPLVTSPPEGTGLLSACTPVTTSHAEYAGLGTVLWCLTISTTTFRHPLFWTPPRLPLLQSPNGLCMVDCRTCVLNHIVVSKLLILCRKDLYLCIHVHQGSNKNS